MSPSSATANSDCALKSTSNPQLAGSCRTTSACRRSVAVARLKQGTQSASWMKLVVWRLAASAEAASNTCGQPKARHLTSAARGGRPGSFQSAASSAATPAPREWPHNSTLLCAEGSPSSASRTTAERRPSRCRAALSIPWCARPVRPPNSTTSGSHSRSKRRSRRQDDPRRATMTQPATPSRATIWPGTWGSPGAGLLPSSKCKTSTPSAERPAQASAAEPRPAGVFWWAAKARRSSLLWTRAARSSSCF
mmetsp:Transcript_41888/g.125206  ORF Transcript_41888/g.125206 Transcript_41888/m.125206 type:complete len:251 (+) Transcript_41888:359-1111(+)